MAKASKNGSSSKINKSAWIRSQPESLKAAEVVEKAKAENIKLTAAQVYTVRHAALKKAPAGKTAETAPVKKGPGRPKKDASAPVAASSRKTTSSSDGLVQQFAEMAVRIGTDKAQRVIDNIKQAQHA